MAAEFLVSGLRCPLAEQRRRGRCHVWLPGGGEAGEDGPGGGRKGSVTESWVVARCTTLGTRGNLVIVFWACATANGTLAQLLAMFERLSGYYCILLSAHFVPPAGLSAVITCYFSLLYGILL